MKIQFLYFLNKLIGRGEKFLVDTMIRCETDEFFNHKLDGDLFWSQFPYTFVSRLKFKALEEIEKGLKKDIEQLVSLGEYEIVGNIFETKD